MNVGKSSLMISFLRIIDKCVNDCDFAWVHKTGFIGWVGITN